MENFKYIIILFVAFLFGCEKKYPEDDKRSCKIPEKRLIENIWLVTDFLVNGQDSSSNIYFPSLNVGGTNGNGFVFKDLQFRFKKFKDKGYNDKFTIIRSFEVTKSGTRLGGGSWEFTNNDDYIVIIGAYKMYLFDPSVESWKILKLTKKEMIVKCFYNNKNYEIRFKKGEF